VTVLRQEYRDGMARLGAAVNIIKTDGPAGRSGMTASAVVSVTDDPPTLAVCINRSSRNNEIIKINGVLAINTLSPHARFCCLRPCSLASLRRKRRTGQSRTVDSN